MQPEMTMRDHFAAAALTGLANIEPESVSGRSEIALMAYELADAMLRERGKLSASDSTAHEGDSCRGGGDCPLPDNAANLDAAPEATATEPEPSAARRRPAGGTGDTQGPVAWAVMLADGERIYDVYAIEEEAKAVDEAVTGNHGIVPLYRSPTLTDAERDLLDTLRRSGHLLPHGAQIIDGLLERLGGAE